jgi:hypothetical protein
MEIGHHQAPDRTPQRNTTQELNAIVSNESQEQSKTVTKNTSCQAAAAPVPVLTRRDPLLETNLTFETSSRHRGRRATKE